MTAELSKMIESSWSVCVVALVTASRTSKPTRYRRTGSCSAVGSVSPACAFGRPPGFFGGCSAVMAAVLSSSRSNVRRKFDPLTLTTAVEPGGLYIGTVTGRPSTCTKPSASRLAAVTTTDADCAWPLPSV